MTTTEEYRAYQRPDGLWIIPRDEFFQARFHYNAGQHVNFAGPTQKGKTKLAFKALEYVATPEVPAYVSVSKPKDPVSSEEGKRLGFRRVADYPVQPKIKESWEGKPSGYLVWADMRNPETSRYNAADVTRRLIHGAYAEGSKGKKCILVLDDTVTKSVILGLDDDMIMVLTMAGAMGVGGWTFVQKPTNSGRTGLWSFSQAEHIFITKDPDKRNRERYREIGGVDSERVDKITLTLKPYQFLYLERTHGYMCVVDSR